MSSATHKTLQVGNVSVTGRVSEEGVVASFLGIPFAKIPERWRQATLIDAFEGAERADLDATRYGPIVPQPPNPSLIGRPDLRASELDCLNLNVWAPASAVDTTAELPVIVWVHGGGYMWSHNSAVDGTHLVRRSVELGRPVLVVAMNYRMHLLGLVGCRELRDEALARGEPGYYNLGLHDQRLAFQWVQRHIHRFGGAPARVTAMGESAGAHSILWHTRAAWDGVPFRRAIVHSSPFHHPLTRADHQARFDAVFAKLGLAADAPAAAKLAAARAMSADEVVAAYDSSEPAFPCVDDGFLADYDPATIGEGSYWGGAWPAWLDAVVIGTTREEGSFCLPEYVSADVATMRAALVSSAGPEPSSQSFMAEVADEYGLTNADDGASGKTLTQAQAFYAFQKFVGDGFFVCHAVDTARAAAQRRRRDGAGPRVFYEAFDQVDEEQPALPWLQPGRWSYHAFDVRFLFYLPSARSRPSYRRVADAMSAAYTSFAHGEAPWEEFGVAGRCGVYAGQGEEEGEEGRGGLGLGNVDERVREGDALRTTAERRDLFRRGAYKLHLNIFEAAAKGRDGRTR